MSKPNEQSPEPLAQREGINLYLQDREREVAEATLQAHGYRLERFAEYCDEHYIENLDNVTGRTVQRYKIWRAEDVNTVTLKSQLDTLRVFLQFCESIDGVMDGVADSIQSPSPSYDENRSDDIVPSEKADEILAYYSKYEYATIHHARFRLLWGSGMRIGARAASTSMITTLPPSTSICTTGQRKTHRSRMGNVASVTSLSRRKRADLGRLHQQPSTRRN